MTSPAGVEPLEVRFAHPVRLSPDTHSQGHGRPCLQRLHPRRAFPATWFIFCDSFKMSIWFRLKRFPRTKHVSKALPYRLKRFRGTKFRFYPTGKRDRKNSHIHWLPRQDSELELYYVNSNRRREPCKDLPMPDFRGSCPWTSGNPGLSS